MLSAVGHVAGSRPKLRTIDNHSRLSVSTLKSRQKIRCRSWWPWNQQGLNSLSKENENNVRTIILESQTSGLNDEATLTADCELTNVSSIAQVSSSDWNACVVESSKEENPFLLHEFLNALEQSGSAVKWTGWVPYHLILRRKSDQRLIGCCPLYIKNHSRGEYVFDHQWAQASTYTGTRYYPKLQSCVPFTPVTGSRLLANPNYGVDEINIKRALANGLKEITDSLNVSSLHLTFNTQSEEELLGQEGYLGRLGVQYHWENPGYADFNEFLMELRQSKRKSIRQERKCLQKDGLIVERLIGDDIKSEHLDQLYDFYFDTCDRKWGDPYLNREFFHMLGDSMNGKVLLVLAKDSMGRYVAGAWNCVGSNALFGRNWGKLSSFHCKHLHFELCYYQALEAAIEMRLDRVEAGAQGEHKIQRGYLPKPTFSSHYIRNDALRFSIQRFVESEREHLQDAIEYMNQEYSPFK